MAKKRGFFCLLLLLVSVLCAAGHAQDQEDEKEWFTKNFCDDGKHMLEVDWDGSDIEYTCPGMTWPDLSEKEVDVPPIEECDEVKDKPLAIVTWGCKLQMPFVDGTAVKFVREHALRAPERRMWMDGHYKEKLLVPSDVVPGSDINDDQLCVDLVGLDFS
uniref:Uncharacterized protein n=1 Tax=Branchiostoma floridae TaxID=7739 RepID=C3XVL0_BRAFL|eukprot:XP_002612127.1 hypothetical protein BRAFLDRAFT_127844 [Branchiostoma floridae]